MAITAVGLLQKHLTYCDVHKYQEEVVSGLLAPRARIPFCVKLYTKEGRGEGQKEKEGDEGVRYVSMRKSTPTSSRTELSNSSAPTHEYSSLEFPRIGMDVAASGDRGAAELASGLDLYKRFTNMRTR